MADPFYYVDGQLDDLAPEERASLAAQATEEWRAEEEATRLEDEARAERRERDEEWRVR